MTTTPTTTRRAKTTPTESTSNIRPGFERDARTLIELYVNGFLSRPEVRLNLARMGVELIGGKYKIPPPPVLRMIEPEYLPRPEEPILDTSQDGGAPEFDEDPDWVKELSNEEEG